MDRQTFLDQVKAMRPGDILQISMFDAFEMQDDGTLRVIVTDVDGRKMA